MVADCSLKEVKFVIAAADEDDGLSVTGAGANFREEICSTGCEILETGCGNCLGAITKYFVG